MLKKLKSLFIVEEELGEQSAPKTSKNAKPSEKKEIKKIPVNTKIAAPGKFVDSLLQAIENNNLDGFDYLEYKQSLKSLANMEMDESTRFNSAFAMAKTMGADKKKLLDSAKHYVGILEEEKSKFGVAYEKQQQKQVLNKQERLVTIENSIKKKEEQIKKLQQEINTFKKEFDQKKNEINSASAKVALTRDQFFAAHKKVNDQILIDIERMNKFLTK